MTKLKAAEDCLITTIQVISQVAYYPKYYSLFPLDNLFLTFSTAPLLLFTPTPQPHRVFLTTATRASEDFSGVGGNNGGFLAGSNNGEISFYQV